ncbi:MAG: dienelactone hydrolase family protein [Eubacteriaceae bacterium]|nr:dienelactone hydrolase family protein [Eubacteriaceae bacterium]
MWNSSNTGDYEGMIAETISIAGHNGDSVYAYFSKPLGAGPYPGIVLIPHMPGWDEFYKETARRFTHHGYAVICPDIFSRFGKGDPSEISAKAREGGGVTDETFLGDAKAALEALKTMPVSNGKTGVIGTCSGGRHAYLAACKVDGFDAAVDCWGGRVVAQEADLTPAQPVAPIDYTENLACPLLGIFGNDDMNPTADQVDILEEALKAHSKDYEFHRYDGCGHGFWYYHSPNYRPVEAIDSWNKVFEFFEKNLK